jgi:hypothetical protein
LKIILRHRHVSMHSIHNIICIMGIGHRVRSLAASLFPKLPRMAQPLSQSSPSCSSTML